MDIKITDIRVRRCETTVKGNVNDSTRHVGTIGFVVVEVMTDQGITGIGVTYNEVGGEAVREFINCSLKPVLIGRNPLETETLYEENFHYIRGVGRKGLAFCAYSAIDIALWDIKGKVVGLPLYKLLGGSDPHVEVYASGGWTSYSTDELVGEMTALAGQGYRRLKMKVGIDSGRNLREDVRRVAAVREAVGPDVGLILDANNAWQSGTAVQFARMIEPYDIEFIEEPVFADDMPGLADFRRRTAIPLATGEHEYTRYGARDLLINGAADIVQCDATRVGGFTETLKIIALTQAFNKTFAPHCMEHMHMHLIAVAPNARYLEKLMIFDEVSENVYLDPPKPVNGIMTIPDKPGLGLELNEAYIREFGKD